VVAASTLAALALMSCGANSATADKSGGDTTPVTLRLGASDGSDAPYRLALERFAESVETGTDGAIHVEIVFDAAAPFDSESEMRLANMVAEGDIDLALVAARAWDLIDVSTFRALGIPFLVDSLPLLNAVAQGEVATKMIAGLDAAGITGLAVLPEALRHPIGFDHPLLGPADFAGAKLFWPTSDVTMQFAEALGVEPVFPADRTAALLAGDLHGADSAFIASACCLPAFGTFTANITVYAKAQTLVANAELFDGLSVERQDVLRQAAADTLAYVVESNQPESELAAAYCEQGGSVALASDADLAGLVELVAPVIAELERDPTTAAFIADIEALKAGLPTDADVVEPCGLPVPDTVPGTGTETASASMEFPEGVYRATSPIDGVVTMEYRDGVWKRYFADGTVDCVSTYEVSNGRIYLTTSSDPIYTCGNPPNLLFLDAAFSLEGDQLRLTDINSDPAAVAEFSLPWTKIE
jgi:TRAP-type C4-dicarboxylate transport system substrate-binding protein